MLSIITSIPFPPHRKETTANRLTQSLPDLMDTKVSHCIYGPATCLFVSFDDKSSTSFVHVSTYRANPLSFLIAF